MNENPVSCKFLTAGSQFLGKDHILQSRSRTIYLYRMIQNMYGHNQLVLFVCSFTKLPCDMICLGKWSSALQRTDGRLI